MSWAHWHKLYASTPVLEARLRIVRKQIAFALDQMPPGPLRIASLCAGDGRDLLGALEHHPRRHDVNAFCFDTDAPSILRGTALAQAAGLQSAVAFRNADAGLPQTYACTAPFHLLILSGFLGRLLPDQAARLIDHLPMLCAPDAFVVWNRHLTLRDGRRQLPLLRAAFRRVGFAEVNFTKTNRKGFACWLSRFQGKTLPLAGSDILFTFSDEGPAAPIAQD